jgi:predicted TIM-barrel fold metal-dependent hydrolase
MDRHGIDRIALIPTMVDPFQLSPFAEGVAHLMRSALQSRLNPVGRLMYRATVTGGGKFSVLGKTYPIYDQPDNDSVARLLLEHPTRFYGWIFVNPRATDPLLELERRASEPGWIGVKAHPFWHRYPVKMLDAVAAWCVEQERPILVHLGGDPERGDYRFLSERHPRLKILYAHAGVPYYQQLWEYAATRPRISVDLSSPYLDEALRRTAVADLGPGRCLYGSDGPYGCLDPEDGGYDHGAILRQIDRLPLIAPDKERILSGNFRELTGL